MRFLLIVALLSGCAHLDPDPAAVTRIHHECANRMAFAVSRADSMNVLDHVPTYRGTSYPPCAMWLDSLMPR